MFVLRETRGAVEVAFTDRHGGVSGGPYATLNLAVRGEEHPDTVAENIGLVAHAIAGGQEPPDPAQGFRLPPGGPVPRVLGMRQVHGSQVHVVADPGQLSGSNEAPEADGIVTTLPGVMLMVRVADCVPVLLADPDRGVVGAAHAGRRGVAGGVVPATVAAMRAAGADRIMAWVGPHVCGRCYEVPAAMREEVAAEVPQARSVTAWGTPALDLGAGVLAQLAAAGVAPVVRTGRCTVEDEDLFSHRRQGEASGRLGGFVWVRP